ncbi:nucleotidyltransferase domain-containing protein [Geobacter sp.]
MGGAVKRGSTAKGQTSRSSDIDIAVLMRKREGRFYS